MDRLQLNQQEIDYYFECFDECDNGNCGKISLSDVNKFLLRSGLSSSTIDEVILILKYNILYYFLIIIIDYIKRASS